MGQSIVAWVVQSARTRAIRVIFESTQERALSAGMLQLRLPAAHCRVKREPAFDKYAMTGSLPHYELVKHGYSTTCTQCGTEICRELFNSSLPIEITDKVLCSVSCFENSLQPPQINFASNQR